MEKLSHIIGTSNQSRIDLGKERPVRAGAASFGQPVNKNVHVYEAPEEKSAFHYESPFNTQKQVSPEMQKHEEIADKVNFSFGKKPELVEENEELMEEKTEASMGAHVPMKSSVAQTAVMPEPVQTETEGDKGKNVHLSIYV